MRKKMKNLCLILFFLIGAKASFGQFQFGISEISVSVSDVKWGLPFLRISPVHPGIEIGATLLENNKEKSVHAIGTYVGYFYHNTMAQAPYFFLDYQYELQIKQTIGIDFTGGVGYLHAFYPGDGYKFNESTRQYESAVVNRAFWSAHLAVGFSYIASERIQPFIRYEQKMLNNVYNQLSMLKVGTAIRF